MTCFEGVMQYEEMQSYNFQCHQCGDTYRTTYNRVINQTNHIIMYKKRFIKNEVNVGMVNNRYNDTIYLTGWVWPSSSVNNYKTATSGQIKTITDFNITHHTLYNSITKWKCILNNIQCQKYIPTEVFCSKL